MSFSPPAGVAVARNQSVSVTMTLLGFSGYAATAGPDSTASCSMSSPSMGLSAGPVVALAGLATAGFTVPAAAPLGSHTVTVACTGGGSGSVNVSSGSVVAVASNEPSLGNLAFAPTPEGLVPALTPPFSPLVTLYNVTLPFSANASALAVSAGWDPLVSSGATLLAAAGPDPSLATVVGAMSNGTVSPSVAFPAGLGANVTLLVNVSAPLGAWKVYRVLVARLPPPDVTGASASVGTVACSAGFAVCNFTVPEGATSVTVSFSGAMVYAQGSSGAAVNVTTFAIPRPGLFSPPPLVVQYLMRPLAVNIFRTFSTSTLLQAVTFGSAVMNFNFTPTATSYTNITVAYQVTSLSVTAQAQFPGALVGVVGTSNPPTAGSALGLLPLAPAAGVDVVLNVSVKAEDPSVAVAFYTFRVSRRAVGLQNATAVAVTAGAPSFLGAPFTLTATLQDATGFQVLAGSPDSARPVTFFLLAGNGTMAPATVIAVNGVAVSPALVIQGAEGGPGGFTVGVSTSTAVGVNLTASTAAFPLSYRNASALVATVTPVSASAPLEFGAPGDALAVTVTVVDDLGSPVTSGPDSSVLVTLAMQAPALGNALAGISPRTAAAVAGVATFAVALVGPSAAGNYSLNASAAGRARPLAIAAPAAPPALYSIADARPVGLAWLSASASINATAGVAFTLGVAIKDARGNTISVGPAASLGVTIVPLSGPAGGLLTAAVTAVRGEAAAKVTFTVAGEYNVSATLVGGALNSTTTTTTTVLAPVTVVVGPGPVTTPSATPPAASSSAAPAPSQTALPSAVTLVGAAPSSAPAGAWITLAGSGFVATTAYTVTFGGVGSGPGYVTSPTTLLCQAVGAAAGATLPSTAVDVSIAGSQAVIKGGFRYVNATSAAAVILCPAATPVPCGGGCATSLAACAATATCPAGTSVSCSAGSCAPSLAQCPPLSDPCTSQGLSLLAYRVCPGGSCVSRASACPLPLPTCTTPGTTPCANLQCATKCEPFFGCPVAQPFMCSAGTCADKAASCPVNADGTLPCPDGSSVPSTSRCPLASWLVRATPAVAVVPTGTSSLDVAMYGDSTAVTAAPATSVVYARVSSSSTGTFAPSVPGSAAVVSLAPLPFAPSLPVAGLQTVPVVFSGNLLVPFSLNISFPYVQAGVARRGRIITRSRAALAAPPASAVCLGQRNPATDVWTCVGPVTLSSGASPSSLTYSGEVKNFGELGVISVPGGVSAPQPSLAPAPPAPKKPLAPLGLPIWAWGTIGGGVFLIILAIIALVCCRRGSSAPKRPVEDPRAIMRDAFVSDHLQLHQSGAPSPAMTEDEHAQTPRAAPQVGALPLPGGVIPGSGANAADAIGEIVEGDQGNFFNFIVNLFAPVFQTASGDQQQQQQQPSAVAADQVAVNIPSAAPGAVVRREPSMLDLEADASSFHTAA